MLRLREESQALPSFQPWQIHHKSTSLALSVEAHRSAPTWRTAVSLRARRSPEEAKNTVFPKRGTLQGHTNTRKLAPEFLDRHTRSAFSTVNACEVVLDNGPCVVDPTFAEFYGVRVRRSPSTDATPHKRLSPSHPLLRTTGSRNCPQKRTYGHRRQWESTMSGGHDRQHVRRRQLLTTTPSAPGSASASIPGPTKTSPQLRCALSTCRSPSNLS